MKFSTILKSLGVSVIVTLLSGCVTAPLETVRMELPHENQRWHVSRAADLGLRQGKIVEYVPDGQNQENWKELISIQFLEGEKNTPSEFALKLKEKINSRCKLSLWSVILEGKNSIIYEWKTGGCGSIYAQHEIARILKGNDGLHRAAYVQKGNGISNEKREKWIETLSNAYVKKDGKRVEIISNNSLQPTGFAGG